METPKNFLELYPDKTRKSVTEALLEVAVKTVRKRHPTGRVPVKMIKLCTETEQEEACVPGHWVYKQCEKCGQAVVADMKAVLQKKLVEEECTETVLQHVELLKKLATLEQNAAYGWGVYKSLFSGKPDQKKGESCALFTPDAFKAETDRKAQIRLKRSETSKRIESDKQRWAAQFRPSLQGKTVSPPPTPPLRISPTKERPPFSIHRQILSPPPSVSPKKDDRAPPEALVEAVKTVLLQLGLKPPYTPEGNNATTTTLNTTASTSVHAELEETPLTRVGIW
eukprot:TRINITY_DN13401_c0_g1_i1.p1 TRINITY_DN13401_c0_g1~~TRINITY_DN13401_c0_g1_i1.p1  ORF type:complete len:282 (+),score=34.97 TRINITY_DN13401_c0_g1_i1:59-904(+)